MNENSGIPLNSAFSTYGKGSYSLMVALVTSLLFLLPTTTKTQDWNPVTPKREFRAVWVATVANIDYPRKQTVRKVPQVEDFKNLLDQYKRLGFNAVIVQVRPAADAFYPSEYAPWSTYLTGKQGTSPQPEYDPLAFMIEEAHKRGLEFHAWLNPYRATMNLDTFDLAANHVFNTHRDWLVQYGNRFYYNPGIAAVREHVTEVVAEVVRNYDVDAIHFDDYFYPYPIRGVPFPDSSTYMASPGRFSKIENWRRNNVDLMIEKVSTRIKAMKPYVKLGISPFGVWRNKDKDDLGSDTRAGVTTFDDLYADVLKWTRNAWIDYLIPQIYWHIGFEPADYEVLLDWWSSRVSATHLYIGHAAYKVGDNPDPAWQDPMEIARQVELNRGNYVCKGSAFFSSRAILGNRLGIKDQVESLYQTPALIPEDEEGFSKRQKEPRLRRITYKPRLERVKIKWRPSKEDLENLPSYYVVYRFNDEVVGDFEDPTNIIHISGMNEDKKKYIIYDADTEVDMAYTYVITAMNRGHNESLPSNTRSVIRMPNRVRKVKVDRPRRTREDKPKKKRKRRNKDEIDFSSDEVEETR
ncbi:MAG: family 10 glycosylhydrolase [Saprospiraceae bacterium]|nr:family 10 glycosylhydrolase [Saprospiraceae bacterium]